jgi:hypothetical protein
MSTLSSRDCYFLGWEPAIVGTHFNGLTTIMRARHGATGELAARVGKLLESWPRRGPAVVARVKHVDGILRGHGLAAPALPQDEAGYVSWAKAILEIANHELADVETDPAELRLERFHRKWANALGGVLGDAIETLDLGAIGLYLLAAAPKHPFLHAQTDTLSKMQAQARKALHELLERVTAAQGLPPAALTLLAEAGQLLDATPLIAAGPVNGPTIEAAARRLESLAVPEALVTAVPG